VLRKTVIRTWLYLESWVRKSHVVAEINKLGGFDFLSVGVNGNHWLEVWSSCIDETENVFYRVEQYRVQPLSHVTRSLSHTPDTPTNRD